MPVAVKISPNPFFPFHSSCAQMLQLSCPSWNILVFLWPTSLHCSPTLLSSPLFLSIHPLPMLWCNTPHWRSEGNGMTERERESTEEKKTDQKIEERKWFFFPTGMSSQLIRLWVENNILFPFGCHFQSAHSLLWNSKVFFFLSCYYGNSQSAGRFRLFASQGLVWPFPGVNRTLHTWNHGNSAVSYPPLPPPPPPPKPPPITTNVCLLHKLPRLLPFGCS